MQGSTKRSCLPETAERRSQGCKLEQKSEGCSSSQVGGESEDGRLGEAREEWLGSDV